MTTFVDNSTVIQAVWLNGVDQAVTQAIGNGSNPPTTPAEAKANLGLDQVNNTSDANKPISTVTQAALDTKISATSTDTLINKTINLNSNTLVSTVAQLNTAVTDGDILTTTGVETLTNKTIDYSANTLTGVVGVSAIQTLSNKTLDGTCTYLGNATNGTPVGTVIDFAGIVAPSGYLVCPTAAGGAQLQSRVTYAALYTALGGASSPWGQGDGSTTFGIPWFPANYAVVQSNANVGTSTVGENLAHTHPVDGFALGGSSGSAVGVASGFVSSGSSGGTANLAAGVRMLKCVKT